MTELVWIGIAVYILAWIISAACLRSDGESWPYSIGVGFVWPLYLVMILLEAAL